MRLLAGIFLTLALVSVGAAPVAAHVKKVRSCPSATEVVSVLDAVDFVFDGPLLVSPERPAEITLVALDGQDRPRVGPTALVDVTEIEAEILEPLQPGAYRASYAVISFDGDLNTGAVEFIFEPESSEATNCTVVLDQGGRPAWVGAILVAVPLAVLLVGLVFVQRWTSSRVAALESESDAGT